MPFPKTCERCKKNFEVKSRVFIGRFCSVKCHGKTNHLDREVWIKYFREKYKTQLEKVLL